MTVRDIGELSFVELEDLMDGMEKYAKREKEYIENGGKERKNANDLLDLIQSGKTGF